MHCEVSSFIMRLPSLAPHLPVHPIQRILSFETALLTFHVATRPTVPQYLLYLVVLLFSLGPLGYPGMHASMTYSRSFTTDVSRAGSGCLRADHLLYLLIYFTSAFKLQSSVKNT